jgi:hypothetical protein
MAWSDFDVRLYRPAIEPLVPVPSFARRCLKAAVFSTMHGFDEQMFGAE